MEGVVLAGGYRQPQLQQREGGGSVERQVFSQMFPGKTEC